MDDYNEITTSGFIGAAREVASAYPLKDMEEAAVALSFAVVEGLADYGVTSWGELDEEGYPPYWPIMGLQAKIVCGGLKGFKTPVR